VGPEFPLGILAINVIGSCAMGLVAGWFAYRGQAPQELRLVLTTGILGGFTTFSAFSFDAALLNERGQPWLAAAYVAASVVLSIGGLFAALWGMRI
jgi:fluoride exporter